MSNDNIFTLANVRKALDQWDREMYPDDPIGWCFERIEALNDAEVCKSLQRLDVMDLVYSSGDIMRQLITPTSNIWAFINSTSTTFTDLAVAAVALAGACNPVGAEAWPPLMCLSGKALLLSYRENEMLQEFEDLEARRKRKQLGGINRSKKYDGPLKLQCRAWAEEIIQRHINEGREKLTKARLALLVEDKYRAFLRANPQGSPDFNKLHPPGRKILPDSAGQQNGTIYRWVNDMVEGQARRKPAESPE